MSLERAERVYTTAGNMTLGKYRGSYPPFELLPELFQFGSNIMNYRSAPDRITLSNGNYIRFFYVESPYAPGETLGEIKFYTFDGTQLTNAFLWNATTQTMQELIHASFAFYIDEEEPEDSCFILCAEYNIKEGRPETDRYHMQIYEPPLDDSWILTFLGGGIINDDDPYDEPGSSGEIGGGGSHDNDSDNIDQPDDPDIFASDTGFVELYTPSVSQMRSLASYLWSSSFDLDNFKKLFQNPMEAILGFSALPFQISAGSSVSVKLGNIDTGISMPKVSNQYKTISCGSLSIEEYWGSYLDYNPHTEIQIYLPYIGTRSLDTDEVMGNTISVVYKIDVLTGGCIAFIRINGSVRYQFSGSCAIQLPINAMNFNSVITGAISIGVASLSAIATGGMSAPVSAGVMAGTIASTANNITSMKTHVEKSGALGGSAGVMGVQIPYLIIKRPNPCIPEDQNKIQGYPAFTYSYLGGLSGFTRVSDIFLDNIDATDAEKDEILSLLKGGVIL